MRKLIIVFSFLWILVVGFDYLNKHPIHWMSMSFFKLYGILFGILAVIAVVVGINQLSRKNEKLRKLKANGISLAIISAIIGWVSCLGYCTAIGFPIEFIPSLTPVIKSFGSFAAISLLTASAYAYGNIINSKIDLSIKKSSRSIIEIAMGIVLITLGMFLFGMMGFLNMYTLAILIAVPIFFARNNVLALFKKAFVAPFSKDDFIHNKFLLLVLVLSSFLVINFVSIQIPFPPGFDSRNFYLNVSQLIEQENGLVAGYQPYNWSLLMSYGYVLFKSPAVAFAVSFLGFLLSIWAAFELMVNYLKISKFDALLVCTIFGMTPAMTNHLFVELKVDFGLLFIQLVSVIVILNIYNDKLKNISSVLINKKTLSLFLFLGILSGYGLGIKLTHLYLLIPLFALIWYAHGKMIGFFALLSITIFGIFISGFDNFAGLSKYHLGVGTYKWLFALGGLALMAWLFIKSKDGFMNALKVSMVFGLMTVFTFAPWVAKNAIDSKGNISFEKLLTGNNPGPKINYQILDRNYKLKKKQN